MQVFVEGEKKKKNHQNEKLLQNYILLVARGF